MTISLVSAPVLGFDLARHPRGAAVADVLLTGLCLHMEDLPVFATTSAGRWPTYRQAAVRAGEASHPLTSLRGIERTRPARTVAAMTPAQRLAEADRLAEVDDDALQDAVDALQSMMILDINVLEELVRRDVLGWCTPGSPYPYGETSTRRGTPIETGHAEQVADVLVDAVAAEWLPDLPAEIAAAFRRPLLQLRPTLPTRAPEVGPCALAVHQIVRDLTALDAAGVRRLRAGMVAARGRSADWAAAVHEASWAVMTTSRVHAAASAQLLAVQAFAASALTVTDAAEGAWNIVSGHVQAAVVSDVLPEKTRRILAEIWLQAVNG